MGDLNNLLDERDCKLRGLESQLKEMHSRLETERRKWSTEVDGLHAELEQLRRQLDAAAAREQRVLTGSRREIARLTNDLEVPSRPGSLTGTYWRLCLIIGYS